MLEMMARVVVGLQATAESVEQLNSAQQQRAAQEETDRSTCLEAAMRSAIPIGSFVFNESQDEYGRQRIAEELTPGYHFVDEAVPGSYRVRIIQPGSCFGAGIDVRRVAAR
jgi:hypothetical protein